MIKQTVANYKIGNASTSTNLFSGESSYQCGFALVIMFPLMWNSKKGTIGSNTNIITFASKPGPHKFPWANTLRIPGCCILRFHSQISITPQQLNTKSTLKLQRYIIHHIPKV